MARPVKQTVDYFPHFCDSNKTIPILENRYGNDGYAFWFKLLELLAKTQGHFYDCNNALHWEFLLTKTLVKEDTANNILDILANLGKIDNELWQSRVIWCQNLVENVADVYKRRQAETPHRPSYDLQKHMIILVNADNNKGQAPIPDNRNRQSKVKYSKVNNIKEGLKSSPFGEDTAKVFYELDRIRGYRPSVKRKAEAASIIRMSKTGYKPEQIIEAWQKLKQDKFWKDKELFMMSVESQIGAIIKGNGQAGRPRQKRRTPITIIRGSEPVGPED